jgi:uncharacterized membrane protein YjgN (DUF898 family)
VAFGEPAITLFGDSPAEAEPLPFAFDGDGREYFRIWIVNLLLSVISLGVYSAWAKVRRLQYFYRNTRVGGFGFDYHANPIAILKGRVIAVLALGLYVGSGLFGPWATLGSIGVLALFTPWALARSFRFRLHNSSYRGIRFRFSGSVQSAYAVFLGWPLLAIASLFTLAPLAQHRAKRYQYANAALGRTPFTFDAPVGEFYVAAVAAAATTFVILVAGFLAIMVVAALGGAAAGLPGHTEPPPFPRLAFLLVYVFGVVAGHAIATARIQNAVWQHTRLGAHRFWCGLSAGRLVGILLSNLALTIVTLGLYRPFAQVRLARYLAESMTMTPVGSLDDFAAAGDAIVSAAGEEAADLFDFDVGF